MNDIVEKNNEHGDRHFLHPGDFYFCDSTGQIHTLLGSCIAITLWHPVLKIGGMCHFVLPSRKVGAEPSSHSVNLDGRYADDAMILFEQAARRYKTALNEYEAKIFGGSNMLGSSSIEEDKLIGTINTEAALKHLGNRKIPLLVAHVGETGHRRIAFDVSNGDVWVKHSSLQKTIPE